MRVRLSKRRRGMGDLVYPSSGGVEVEGREEWNLCI